jgi:hypothetical protein
MTALLFPEGLDLVEGKAALPAVRLFWARTIMLR